jgi:hypothetical protein
MNAGFKVDEVFEAALKSMGLDSIDAIFAFEGGRSLSKATLAKYRRRIKFDIANPPTTLFLKSYNNTPIPAQIRNWVSHHQIASTMFYDLDASKKLSAAGINTPRAVCYGEQRGLVFEKRSFIITEQIPGESLERLLPPCFDGDTNENLKERRKFVGSLAEFARRVHATGYCHRDFYFAHIFHHNGEFYLIDLQRAFKPLLLSKRYRIKDIAQLSYSAAKKHFTRTDRMRFYLKYAGKTRLDQKDKLFILAVLKKMLQMAGHDRRHNRIIPFEN